MIVLAYLVLGIAFWVLRTVLVVAVLVPLLRRLGQPVPATTPAAQLFAILIWPLELVFFVWIITNAARLIASAWLTQRRLARAERS